MIGGGEDSEKTDAMSYLDQFDALTKREDNHFTKEDIIAASKAYHDNSCKFPIKKIEALTLFRIDSPSRRNGLKQGEHLEIARAIRDIKIKQKGQKKWDENNGRKPEIDKVQAWRAAHPESKNKSQCARDLGLSRPTVRKWWD